MKRFSKFLLVLALALISAQGVSAQNVRFQGNAKVTCHTICWEQYNLGALSVGARFSDSNYLGIGSGSLWLSRTERGAHNEPIGKKDLFFSPVYLDYIHYFNNSGAKRNSFFLGAEAGGSFLTKGDEYQKRYYHADLKCGYDFGFTKNFGAFVEADILAGYAYGLGITAGLRF